MVQLMKSLGMSNLTVKMEVEDSLEDEYAPLTKRPKFSLQVNQVFFFSLLKKKCFVDLFGSEVFVIINGIYSYQK